MVKYPIYLAAAMLSIITSPLYAQVYVCTNEQGIVEYTNAKKKNCKELNLPKLTTIPAPSPMQMPARNNFKPLPSPFSFGANQAPPPAFPNINQNTQSKRDDDRKNILKQELQSEQKKLQELQKEYNNGTPERQGGEKNYQKYLDRVEQMKKDISRSQGNTESLMKELGL